MLRLDSDLNKCYDHDLQWDLLPSELKEVSIIPFPLTSCQMKRINLISFLMDSPCNPQICAMFGKGMKQRETRILLGTLSTISFSMGHAAIEVTEFWSEAIIVSTAIVLPTGTGAVFPNYYVLYVPMRAGFERYFCVDSAVLPFCCWGAVNFMFL